MKVIEKEQVVFEAMQFDASKPKEKWPAGVIEHPGQGWFFVAYGREIGLSDGDWIVMRTDCDDVRVFTKEGFSKNFDEYHPYGRKG